MKKLSIYRLKTSNRLKVTIDAKILERLLNCGLTSSKITTYPKILRVIDGKSAGVFIVPSLNVGGRACYSSHRSYIINDKKNLIQTIDSYTKKVLSGVLIYSVEASRYKQRWLPVSVMFDMEPTHEIPFLPNYCDDTVVEDTDYMIQCAYKEVTNIIMGLISDRYNSLYHSKGKTYRKIYEQILYRQEKINGLANLDFYLLARVDKTKLVLANEYGLMFVDQNQVYHCQTYDDPLEQIWRTKSAIFQSQIWQWLLLAVNRKDVLDNLSSGNSFFPEQQLRYIMIEFYTAVLADENATILKTVLKNENMDTNKARLIFLKKVRDDGVFENLLRHIDEDIFKLEMLGVDSFLYNFLKTVNAAYVKEIGKFNSFVKKSKHLNQILEVNKYNPNVETMYTYPLYSKSSIEEQHSRIMGVI